MTTWPEQIRWTEAESMGLIDPAISSTHTLSQHSIFEGGVMTRKVKSAEIQLNCFEESGFIAKSSISLWGCCL